MAPSHRQDVLGCAIMRSSTGVFLARSRTCRAHVKGHLGVAEATGEGPLNGIQCRDGRLLGPEIHRTCGSGCRSPASARRSSRCRRTTMVASASSADRENGNSPDSSTYSDMPQLYTSAAAPSYCGKTRSAQCRTKECRIKLQ